MASIPGTIPVTSGIAPTDTTDTFATHIDIYGEGGYMTVADQTEREAITTERRKQGMAVFQNDTNKMYILQGGTANTNWTEFTGGGIATMQNVFDASTPNVDATDQSKTLSLTTSDITLTADNDDPNAPATATGDLSLVSNSDIGGHHNTPTRLRLRGGQYGQGELGLLGIAAQDPLVSSPAVGDILIVDSLDPLAPGAPIWATEAKLKFARPSSLNVGGLQSVMNNGSVGDVTTNIDLITQDAAIASGRFCRMRTFLSGTTTRTTLVAQGLVGDLDAEVILSAQDAGPGSGEQSRMVLSGMTGDIIIKGTGMGTPAVGDVLSVRSVGSGVTSGEATMEWTSGIKSVKVNISDAQVQTLHSTPVSVIPIPVGKRLQVLSIMGYLDISYTNNRVIQFYYDGCNSGGGNTAISFAKSLFTRMGDNTGAYIPVASGSGASASWGNNCSSLKVKLDLASGTPLMTPANGIDLYITYLIIDP